MVAADQVNAIFADARNTYQSALLRLDAGDVRDAAEKAWCATKRATDAMILARTGSEPRTTGQTGRELGRLESQDQAFRSLRQIYARQQTYLHGGCFYDGDCGGETIPADIKSTIDYIEEMERLAWEIQHRC